MGIYTKTGDQGQTSLFDGQRVKKYSNRVETYGTLDECNTHISLAEKQVMKPENRQYLMNIQNQLFLLSAEVATRNLMTIKEKSQLISRDDSEQLEKIIDEYTATLPPVKEFILPGQSLAGAQLHVARAVSRRAERHLVSLAEEEDIRAEVLIYINRLSDFLYILARSEDHYAFQQKLVKRVIDIYLLRMRSERSLSVNSMISYDVILKIQEAVLERAEFLGVPVTLSLVDESGTLIYSYRMPTALLVSVELAEKKAFSAVAMKLPTADLGELVSETGELRRLETSLEGKLVSFGGGIPLYYRQQLIGGVGISGGTVAQDIELATIATKCYQKEVSECLNNN